MTEQTGGCLCSDVRLRLVGAPYEVDYCHCHSCRKHTGAPVSAFADFKGGVVEFTKGAPPFMSPRLACGEGSVAAAGRPLPMRRMRFLAKSTSILALWIVPRTFRRTGSRLSPMSGFRGFGLRVSIRCGHTEQEQAKAKADQPLVGPSDPLRMPAAP